MKLKLGDSVRVRGYGIEISGTVTRVGRWKVRVLIPIRKFEWFPIGCCEKITRRKS